MSSYLTFLSENWLSVSVTFLLIFSICAGMSVIYVWIMGRRFKRERFAMNGFATLASMGLIVITSIVTDNPIQDFVFSAFSNYTGVPHETSQVSGVGAALIIVIYFLLIRAYTTVHSNWPEDKMTKARDEEIRSGTSPNPWRDILLVTTSSKLLELVDVSSNDTEDELVSPQHMTWEDTVRELFEIKQDLKFDEDFFGSDSVWIAIDRKIEQEIAIFCDVNFPSTERMKEIEECAAKFAEREQPINKFIVAVKNSFQDAIPADQNFNLEFLSYDDLLDNIFKFENYVDQIKSRIDKIVVNEHNLTLAQTFTEPNCLDENREEKGSIFNDQDKWYDAQHSKPLVWLGEYGMGKSSTALKLCANYIGAIEHNEFRRMPILIELRGRPLRSMTAHDIFGSWCSQFGGDARALFHLHQAGKLLLIFEGFDEIDTTGDADVRAAHFKSIWNMNYENSKILITGRPNFFLDTAERRRAFGTKGESVIRYIKPLNVHQIDDALRNLEDQKRKEIVAFADKNSAFYELASRPSHLAMIAELWGSEDFNSIRHRLNSVNITSLFIDRTILRQQEKHALQFGQKFMILNSSERRYFMSGIAAYMCNRGLPNQISGRDLNSICEKLADVIPDAVSRSISPSENSDSIPLRSEDRLQWKDRRIDCLLRIYNDVRTCSLLETDPSRDGFFRFAHKSYSEYLQAELTNELYSDSNTDDSARAKSLFNVTQINKQDAFKSAEIIAYLCDFVSETASMKHDRGRERILFDLCVLEIMPSTPAAIRMLALMRLSVSNFLRRLFFVSSGWSLTTKQRRGGDIADAAMIFLQVNTFIFLIYIIYIFLYFLNSSSSPISIIKITFILTIPAVGFLPSISFYQFFLRDNSIEKNLGIIGRESFNIRMFQIISFTLTLLTVAVDEWSGTQHIYIISVLIILQNFLWIYTLKDHCGYSRWIQVCISLNCQPHEVKSVEQEMGFNNFFPVYFENVKKAMTTRVKV